MSTARLCPVGGGVVSQHALGRGGVSPGGCLPRGGGVCPGKGVSDQGRGVCPGGCLPKGVSALGGVCPGGCLPGGVSAQGGVCLGGVCPGGVCPGGVCPGGVYHTPGQTPFGTE